MAPRKSVKSVSATNNNYNNFSLSDVMCPICRSILIEPVSLPCSHGFCVSCFENSVQHTNLTCPLCRVRIGSWLRLSRKNNKLVNKFLWDFIQKTFPTQVKNKLEGVEESVETDTAPRILTKPGELRQEYEIEKAKLEKEIADEHQKQIKANEEFIRKLRDKEEAEKKLQEENERRSEQVAKKLAEEYSFDPGPSSSKCVTKPSLNYLKKKGPLDKLINNINQKKLTVTLQSGIQTTKEYTCKILCQDRNSLFENTINWKIQDKLKKIATEREASDSNDSIDAECRYFRPIEQKYIPILRRVPILKVPGVIRTANTVIIGPPKGKINFNHAPFYSAFAKVEIITVSVGTPSKDTAVNSLSTQPNYSCDTIITELLPLNNSEAKTERIDNSDTHEHNSDIKYTTMRRYDTRMKSIQSTSEECVNSKRTLSKVSPVDNEFKCTKRFRNSNSPPCHGFDNKTSAEAKTKTNGAILFTDLQITKNLKKLQEERDFEFARKLQEELNNSTRYSTRRSINLSVKNIKKTSTRQVTLNEMFSKSMVP